MQSSKDAEEHDRRDKRLCCLVYSKFHFFVVVRINYF